MTTLSCVSRPALRFLLGSAVLLAVGLVAVPAGAVGGTTPSNVMGVGGDGSVAVSWSAPTNPASTVNGYTVTASDVTTPANGGETCSTSLVEATADAGDTPVASVVSPDGSTLYVANANSSSVTVIATASDSVTGIISVSGDPSALAISPDGSDLYVAQNSSGTVGEYATASGDLVQTFAVAPAGDTMGGIALSPDGSTLYVVDQTSADLQAFATADTTALWSTSVGLDPNGVVASSDGSTVYVANTQDRSISVVGTASESVLTTITGLDGAYQLALNPAGMELYVSDEASHVDVINTANDNETGTISVNGGPAGLAVSSDGSTLYSADTSNNTVDVVNLSDNIVTEVLAAASPVALGLDSSGDLFVSETGSDTVAEFSTSNYIPSTTCAVTGLTNGDSYTFSVEATEGDGGTATSAASAAVVPSTTPGAPTDVSATETSGTSATVSWGAVSSTGGSAITGYEVSYAVSPYTSWSTPEAEASSPAVVTGLTSGSYEFEVAAQNVDGFGPLSDPSTPVTLNPVPGDVTDLSATSNQDSESEVTWDAPADTGGGITGYSVEEALSPYTTWTTATGTLNGTSELVTGLTNGTSYEFEVAAINNTGTGDYVSSAAVVPSTTPDAPVGVVASEATGTSASVSWSDGSSTGGSAITGYEVSYAASPYTSWSTPESESSSPVLISGLTSGSYEFEVASENVDGFGPMSDPSAPVTLNPVPGDVTNLTATSNQNEESTVTWNAPAVIGGGITGYSVEEAVSPYTTWTPATGVLNGTSELVTGLTNGTSYEFEVAASDSTGTGSYVSSAPATPATAPNAPTSVTAVAGSSQVTVSWAAPADGGSAITSYQVTGSPSGSCTTTQLACVITGLTNGTTYSFSVTATNAAGTSVASSLVSATPAAAGGGGGGGGGGTTSAPGAPTGVSATPGNGQVSVSWLAPTNTGGSAITGYQVSGNPSGSCSTTTTACVVTGLANGTTYSFSVTATNAAGTSVASESVSVVAGNGPGAPSAISSTVGETSVVLKWVAGADNGSAITGYTVVLSPGGAKCSVTTTTCTISGLGAGTTYSASVSETNANGTSSATTYSFSTTKAPVAPATARLTSNPFVGTKAVLSAKGRAALAKIAATIVKNGDKLITIDSYVSGLYTRSEDVGEARERGLVVKEALLRDVTTDKGVVLFKNVSGEGATRVVIIGS